MAVQKRHLEWRKIGEFVLVFWVIPTLIFWVVAQRSPAALKVAYYSIVSLFVFQAALSYIQSSAAFTRRPFPQELPDQDRPPVPKTTFIVCAYLPNEVDVVQPTLLNVLQDVHRPESGIEIILSYNTPELAPIEAQLRNLAYQHPELILANAHGSRSKSENLNYALGLASGGMIALLDADHLVAPDCLERAWRWLAGGYDVVQGRCKVRNGDASNVSALVEPEFAAIYGVSHYAKSRLFNTALFGGSNGYWKAEVLKEIGFRTDVLTEDIDATLRALLAGYRIVHDRSIVSQELAPETLDGLWYQRKRWAQGWYQCSVRYQWQVWRSPYLEGLPKLAWTLLLGWRVIYDSLSHLLLPVLLSYWLYRHQIAFPMTPFIWFAIIFTLSSGPFEALAAFTAEVAPRAPARRFLYYALMTFPYTILKNVIHMIAIRDELIGQKEWVVSPRQPEEETP